MASNREADAQTVQAMMAARNQREPAATPTDVVFEKFVLYKSDRSEDVGSRTLLSAIEPVVEDFRIIDVSQLQSETLPEWLDGTPVVVDMRDKQRLAHRGSAALDLIEDAYPSVTVSHR